MSSTYVIALEGMLNNLTTFPKEFQIKDENITLFYNNGELTPLYEKACEQLEQRKQALQTLDGVIASTFEENGLPKPKFLVVDGKGMMGQECKTKLEANGVDVEVSDDYWAANKPSEGVKSLSDMLAGDQCFDGVIVTSRPNSLLSQSQNVLDAVATGTSPLKKGARIYIEKGLQAQQDEQINPQLKNVISSSTESEIGVKLRAQRRFTEELAICEEICDQLVSNFKKEGIDHEIEVSINDADNIKYRNRIFNGAASNTPMIVETGVHGLSVMGHICETLGLDGNSFEKVCDQAYVDQEGLQVGFKLGFCSSDNDTQSAVSFNFNNSRFGIDQSNEGCYFSEVIFTVKENQGKEHVFGFQLKDDDWTSGYRKPADLQIAEHVRETKLNIIKEVLGSKVRDAFANHTELLSDDYTLKRSQVTLNEAYDQFLSKATDFGSERILVSTEHLRPAN